MSSRTDEQIGLLHQRWTLGGQKSTKNSQTKAKAIFLTSLTKEVNTERIVARP